MEIVWNHRWEYDKGIELLAHIIEQVKEAHLDSASTLLDNSFATYLKHLKKSTAPQ